MPNNQHIIRKQTLELELPEEQGAYELMADCSNMMQTEVAKLLDDYFSKVIPDDQTLYIPELTIDIGEFSREKFSGGFARQCLLAIQKALSEKIASSPVKGEDIRLKSPETILEESFIYFLEFGILPWYVGELQLEDKLISLAERQEYKPSELFISAVMQLLRSRSNAITRLSRLSDETLQYWLYLIFPDLKNQIGEFTQTIKNVTGDKAVYWELFIQLLMQNPPPEQFSSLAEAITSGKNLPERQQKIIKEQELPPAAEEGIYIQNAGLVILHPYLESFFEELQLVKAGRFINDQAQCKAIRLLHYLLSEEEAPEYLLALNKLLCGWSLNTPLTDTPLLTDNEKAEAEQLLEAIIRNWSALKNSSTDALRETFLQRKGKLSYLAIDQYWRLQVSESGVDILLDKLPWGISVIKLPWMPERLMAEWRT